MADQPEPSPVGQVTDGCFPAVLLIGSIGLSICSASIFLLFLVFF